MIKTATLDKEKIKKLMEKKGIRSISALSRKAGMSDGTLTNSFTVRGGVVSARSAMAAALVLGVNINDILVDAPAPEKEPEKEETKPDGAFLQRQLTLRELKLQTELLQKIYDLLK